VMDDVQFQNPEQLIQLADLILTPEVTETVEGEAVTTPTENDLGISQEQLATIRSFLEESGLDLTTATQEEIIPVIQKALYSPEGNVLNQLRTGFPTMLPLREGEERLFHGSPSTNIKEFDLSSESNEGGGDVTSGIFSSATRARSENYGENVYELAVELGKVGIMYPYTPEGINQAMEDKYLEILNRHGDHVPNWAEGEAANFRETGSISRFSGKEKREIWLAGGYDTIRDGKDYISLHPEAVRILSINGKPVTADKEFFQSCNAQSYRRQSNSR